MIKRITIENYMAHRHTVLELGPGVTVLTGPNNVGKSAVVEAIRSVAQNPAPEHVIRHGASQAVVRVELDSGEIIEWVRKKASAVYRLYRPAASSDSSGAGSGSVEGEAEVYAKFGRTPPDDIRQLRAQAEREYGTSDSEELRRLLEERREENDRMVEEYQRHVEDIQRRLKEIDESGEEAGSPEA